jgi:hypothetical protein
MTRAILTLAMLAAAALMATGCGGSSASSGVAHLGSDTSSSADPGGGSPPPERENSASAQRKMIAFSQCMRSHGVPEFPEPSEGRLIVHNSSHNGRATGFNPESAQFQAAQKACAKLAPNGGKPPSPAEQARAQEKALKFSQCMRAHGVPSFPDPEFSHGGGAVRIHIGSARKGGPSGIDPNSPEFQTAQKACQSIMGGPKGFPGAAGGPQGAPGPGAVAVAP